MTGGNDVRITEQDDFCPMHGERVAHVKVAGGEPGCTCPSAPPASSNNVTITEQGHLVVGNVGIPAAVVPAIEAYYRAKFAAERMPEDVQKLVAEARGIARSLRAFQPRPGEWASGGVHDNDRKAGIVDALADRLEAAYSQKAEAWDEGANAELARARSQGADDPGIPHPVNPYRKGAVDEPR